MLRSVAILTGIVLALGLCRLAHAAQQFTQPTRPCPNNCIPNSGNFGYYPTVWRQWPGENRPEQTNPRSFGATVIPTPQGQEQLPLPRAATPSQVPPTQPQPPAQQPQEGGILPPVVPPTPSEIPAEPKPQQSPKSSADGSLPGLPVEPDQSILPSPFETGPKKEAPKAKEEPKEPVKEEPKPQEQPKPKAEPKPVEQPKPKAESKPLEQPKPKAEPKPKKTEKTQSNMWPEKTETISTAVLPSDTPDGTVVSLFGGKATIEVTHPPVTNTYQAESIASTPPVQQTPPADKVTPAAYAIAESTESDSDINDNFVAPSAAMGGYCPVEIICNGHWVRGDLRWTVVHNGKIYRLSGPAQRLQFMADPDAFAPAYSGNDPVLTVDEHRTVPGLPTYCATFNGRLYMFSTSANQTQFNKDPQRYATGK